MSNDDLKGCPFCGDQTPIVKEKLAYPHLQGAATRDLLFYVVCSNRECRIRTASQYPREDAVKTWNRRGTE